MTKISSLLNAAAKALLLATTLTGCKDSEQEEFQKQVDIGGATAY